MAGSFNVVSANAEPLVLSPKQVLDVMKVGFVTQPTGIYAEVPVPLQAWLQEGEEPNIGPYAETIEGLIANTAAVDADYRNDLDRKGLLVDFLDFIVEYRPPGRIGEPLETRVEVTLGSLGASSDPWFARLAASPESLINKAYQRLVETAGL